MTVRVIEDFTEHLAQPQRLTLPVEGPQVELPSSLYVRDADLSRDGSDLVLETAEGTILVEGYFAQATPPALVAPDGTMLTPELVQSFLTSEARYADNAQGMTDVSPVGAVQEIKGEATVTRADGKVEALGVGSPIYQGDIIETSEDGAVNIIFMDESTFAVSSDARLAIDEYVFDPSTQAGTSNFSVLKGVFVFTSGLIGREDPDDVQIDTPAGSIGIRGTIILGNVDTGEITVIEGAIVLTDYNGNSVTLSDQYETALFMPSENRIEFLGKLSAEDISNRYEDVSSVSSDLFSTIREDANAETGDKESSLQNEFLLTDEMVAPDNGSGTLETDLVNYAMSETVSSEDPAAPPVTTQTQDLVDPPFMITVEKFAFAENVAGAPVARLTALNADFAVILLASVSRNFYDIVRESATTFLVSLKPGVSMDYEDPVNIIYFGTDLQGGYAANVTTTGMTNVDEATTLTGDAPNNVGSSNYFAASNNNDWSYDFSNAFHDPEGQIASYNVISAPVNPGFASYTFNPVTGLMQIQMNNTLDGSNEVITVQALDASSNILASTTITFDTIIQDNFTGIMVSNNETFSSSGAISDTVNVSSNFNNVFTDDGNDNIIVAGNNSNIMAGDGDDSINLVAGNFTFLHGGSGHDTFVLAEMDTVKAYGGDDSDYFRLSSTAVNDLETYFTGLLLDGGGDNLSSSNAGDIIILDTAGGIDFTTIDDAIIKNIETLRSDNGLANTITLDYTSVVAMTDNDKILIIDMDGNDTLNFTNGSGNTFYSAGQTNNAGETYNVYTDGIVTLLIDTEAGAVAVA
ncbi:MAG: FecR domain-containing protein [Alphaproteobacteria bacterium]|nr:FecR domain-containing protein [Alphaproteobacteria bacterium]MBP7760117.1 FecR domain-containing protein [Alphaproteobacteria bacterium]MBP7763486.1 FecR domain-containing protein [Alphaproteobacteria bacterium]